MTLTQIERKLLFIIILIITVLGFTRPVLAHDPIFGLGPHTLYKRGLEITNELAREEAGNERVKEWEMEITLGFSGDLAIGVTFSPYVEKQIGAMRTHGNGDLEIFGKYRFWRHDTLGAQESTAILLRTKFNNADDTTNPPLGSGSTDTVFGLTYGYEGRKWYRWVSMRYRRNGRNMLGLNHGNKWLIDLAGGFRPHPTGYREPDTVWLLELNGEYSERDEISGVAQDNSGGREWFISPGIFWTKRNFAIKAGIQIPIKSHLNENQVETDYRGKIVLEWHL